MEEFINVFKALSDRTRLRIVRLLGRESPEVCVCEIIDSLSESQYNVSRHIKVLKGAGLVRERKEGRWVYYSLTDPLNDFQDFILKAVNALPDELLSLDEERLRKRLYLRVGGNCVVGMNSEEWIRMRELPEPERR